MARIAGINIPMNKHVVIGLTSIFGVGRTQALKACAAPASRPTPRSRISPRPKSPRCARRSRKLTVEGDLRRESP